MPLTFDRPNVTAATLNSLWSTLVSRVAPTLPTPIRDPNGDGSTVFDNIDLDEADPEARLVVSPEDLVGAIIAKGNAFGGARWLRSSLDNSIAGDRIEVRESYTQTGTTLASSLAARSVLPRAYSFTEVQPIGSTGLTITAARVVSDAPSGWGLTTAIGEVETFAGLGFVEWNPGEPGLVTEIESFDGVGLDQWSPGSVFLLGETESLWSGWPAGTQPVIPSGGQCLDSSDLTSQVDGIRSSFTVPEVFEAGTLRVYLNGQRLSGSMVTEDSTTSFTLSQITAVVGDTLVVDYCPC